jgi:glutamate synthase domain-containing protein 1
VCGIVGLFLKNARLEPHLGALLEPMLTALASRGPDSAGIAVYGEPEDGLKITLGDHRVVRVADDALPQTLDGFAAAGISVSSVGRRMEIYKDVGQPAVVAARLNLAAMRGSHAIGHTRMATESAVTIDGAHPFSTGVDQCLVHNGSLSNHHSLRRRLAHDGVRFATDNDSEVAAAFLSWRMARGASLRDALDDALDVLDGFFTFVVGTEHGFAVLRDPVACKPAVMAETDDYVAFGSEYRALTGLPGIDRARVWEPRPATVYVWEHAA